VTNGILVIDRDDYRTKYVCGACAAGVDARRTARYGRYCERCLCLRADSTQSSAQPRPTPSAVWTKFCNTAWHMLCVSQKALSARDRRSAPLCRGARRRENGRHLWRLYCLPRLPLSPLNADAPSRRLRHAGGFGRDSSRSVLISHSGWAARRLRWNARK